MVGNKRGIAILEFVIVLPFLVLLLLVTFDLGVMLSHNMLLSSIAHSGLRLAQQTVDLEIPGGPPPRSIYLTNETPPSCGLTPTTDSLPLNHRRVHSKMIQVMCRLDTDRLFHNLQNPGVPNSNAIQMSLERKAAGLAEDSDTVSVVLRANYHSFIPLVGDFPFSVRAIGPYLY